MTVFARLRPAGGASGIYSLPGGVEIPVAAADWAGLEQLAAAVATRGGPPSAGEVAGVLLRRSVRSALAELAAAPDAAASSLAADLAAHS